MNKQHLKTGMTVKLRDGEKYVVLLGTEKGDVIVSNDCFLHLDRYNENLYYKNDEFKKWDIVSVNGVAFSCGIFGNNLAKGIWSREKTITIDGKDIQISIDSFNELKKQLLEE